MLPDKQIHILSMPFVPLRRDGPFTDPDTLGYLHKIYPCSARYYYYSYSASPNAFHICIVELRNKERGCPCETKQWSKDAKRHLLTNAP